ncbi:TPA: hypothetical protein ACMDN5_000001 [Vibrio cholerae]
MDTFSFIKDVVEVFELPKVLLAITAALLWISKVLVVYFQNTARRKVETLSQIVEYFKENPRHDFFIVEQLFLKYFNESYRYLRYRNGKSNLKLEELKAWVQYIIFGGGGIMMFFNIKALLEHPEANLIVWICVASYLGLLGCMSLSKVLAIQAAKDLIKLQRKHT